MEPFEPVNPLFLQWWNAQTIPVQEAIAAEWNRLGDDPAIAHNWHSGPYARRTALIRWCADNHGYVIR